MRRRAVEVAGDGREHRQQARQVAGVASGDLGVDIDVPGEVDLAGDERRGGVLEGQAGVRGQLPVLAVEPRRVVREGVLGERGGAGRQAPGSVPQRGA